MDQSAINFAVSAVMTDARFVVRFGRHAQALNDMSSTLMLASGGWISMLVHEGARVLGQHAPQLLHGSPDDAAEIIAKARHGMKLFEDTHRSIDEYQDHFREIAEQHRRRLIAPVAFPIRFLARDLGLASVNKKLVLTSHGVLFNMGLPPEAVNDPSLSDLLGRISYEWGAYVALAGLATEGAPLAALDEIADVKTRTFDMMSSRLYRKSFNGGDTPYLNAVLLYFESLCNSVACLLPRSTHADESERFTVFKVRLVVAVHLLLSLRRLVRHDVIGESVREEISSVLDGVRLDFGGAEVRRLRNLLVHYVPAKTFDFHLVDTAPLLDAAVAGVGSSHTADDLAKQVDDALTDLSQGFDSWRGVLIDKTC